jgi:hypothetical protein
MAHNILFDFIFLPSSLSNLPKILFNACVSLESSVKLNLFWKNISIHTA